MFGAVSSMATMIGIENRGRLAFYSRKPGVCDAEGGQGQGYGGVTNAGFTMCRGERCQPWNKRKL